MDMPSMIAGFSASAMAPMGMTQKDRGRCRDAAGVR
jgi:hypothetical protein